MKCPECGAWTEVVSKRSAWRRRECANGHRFNTVETLTKLGPSSFHTRKKKSSSTEPDKPEQKPREW